MESYFIPSGPKNLEALFPAVNFDKILSYWIVVKDINGNVIGTTPLFQMNCCCPDGYIRIEFMNDSGTRDAVNFGKPYIIQSSQSSIFQKAKISNSNAKDDFGLRRFNVVANDVYECTTTCYDEGAMEWLSELFRSPIAYLHHEGNQGQQEYILPINILDTDFTLQKNAEEYVYLVTLKFNLANIYSSIRP